MAEATAGSLRPVYLVAGEEGFLASGVVAALKAAVAQAGVPGLNEDQFQAGEADVDRVISAALTLPMMARRRFVLVRGLERWEPKAGGKNDNKPPSKSEQQKDPLEKLLDYVKSPAPSTVLVLFGASVDKRRKLYVQARTDGFLVACEPLSRQDLPRCLHVRRAAAHRQRLGVSFSGRASRRERRPLCAGGRV